jgi:hypothetical protein
MDADNVFLYSVVDGERKSFGQQAVISEIEAVNAGIEIEGLYI